MTKQVRNILLSGISLILMGLGISLQIKSNIGQSILNAFALSLSEVSHYEVGKILNIINTIFFILYVLIKRFKLNLQDYLQIIAIIANGYIINYFVYSILATLTVDTYFFKVLLFVAGLSLTTTSLGLLLAIGLIRFPIESFSIALGDLLQQKLSFVRLTIDVLFLVLSLLAAKLFQIPLFIREGTIISLILFAPLLGLTYNHFKKYF